MADQNVTATTNSRLMGKSADISFPIMRGGSGGVAVIAPTGTSPNNICGIDDTLTASPWLYRTCLIFDLTTLSPQFSGASLKVWSYAVGVDFNGVDEGLRMVAGIAGSALPTINSDWLSANSETVSLGNIDAANVTTGGFVTITFNTDGVAWLKTKAGSFAKIICMPYRDFANNYRVVVNQTKWNFYLPQESGKEPYLVLADYGQGLYPTWNLSRVTGIRHIYRPGSYRLEATIGDVSTEVELAQRTLRVPTVVPTGNKEFPTTEVTMPKRTADELIQAIDYGKIYSNSDKVTAPPPTPIVSPPSLWSRLTPWNEQAGETFPSEVKERIDSLTRTASNLWQAITPWNESAGETFGGEVKERVDAVSNWFKGLFK